MDDGKSTLIGRLLHECQAILDDQRLALERDSRRFGTTGEETDFALALDGLDDERQQGITIDVAYRYFSTPRRAFIVADAPGHVQYTGNMATAASNSDLAVILVDARKGILEQTRRHATICSLLGLRSVLLAVNKIDLVGFDQAAFEAVEANFGAFATPLGFQSITAIPLSARYGDNLAERSRSTLWYSGPTLVDALETAEVETRRTLRPFRFSVQLVTRPGKSEHRGLAGTVSSGRVAAGDEIVMATSGRSARVARIGAGNVDRREAEAGDAVTLILDSDVDVARGDLLCAADELPAVADQLSAHLIWLSADPLLPGRVYLMRILNRLVPATVTSIKHKLDIDRNERVSATKLEMNEIAVCNLSTTALIAFDPFKGDPETGAFILIDRMTNATAAAGLIDFALRRAGNVHSQKLTINKQARTRLLRQRPLALWFTGLSGAGKSTIADLVERALHEEGHLTYVLDGDNFRRGLSKDLGFKPADRVENVRRAGEVAKLLVDAGIIVLCSFVSPFVAERQMVREQFEAGEFVEIFVDAPLEVCIARDPKGLYAQSSRGTLDNLTGVSSPYEPPPAPNLRLRTDRASARELADEVVRLVKAKQREV